MNYITKFFQLVAFMVLFSAMYLTSTFAEGIYHQHKKGKISNADIYVLYKKILAQTGQIQDALPLFIVELPVVNAYNDGHKVVLFRGLIEYTKNPDELALVLAHEIAHGMLKHVYYPEFHKSTTEVAVAEANADKLGAYYIMRAGYNICVARELWGRMRHESGNYLGADHPDYSYRFDELDVNCEK